MSETTTDFTLKQLAEALGVELFGEHSRIIKGVSAADSCQVDQITFVTSDKWLRKLKPENIGAVIVSQKPEDPSFSGIIHPHPQLAMVEVMNLFYPAGEEFSGISDRAYIADSARIAEPVTIEPFASVATGAVIGPRTILRSGVRIGKNVTIGSDCVLHPNVVIEDECVLGDNVILHAGAVIGADGFGYIQHEDRNIKFPQVGRVIIGDDVELGANTCVDRGAMGDTVIGDGVKMDNLVQIGHNNVIGDHTVIVGLVGIGGSCNIGHNSMFSGFVGMVPHTTVGPKTVVTAHSVVTKDHPGNAVLSGCPAYDGSVWRKAKVIEQSLPKHWKKIKKLINDDGK